MARPLSALAYISCCCCRRRCFGGPSSRRALIPVFPSLQRLRASPPTSHKHTAPSRIRVCGGNGGWVRGWGGGVRKEGSRSLIFCCHLENNSPIPVVAVCSIIVCAASHPALTQCRSSAQSLPHSPCRTAHAAFVMIKIINNKRASLLLFFVVGAPSFSWSLSFSQFLSPSSPVHLALRIPEPCDHRRSTARLGTMPYSRSFIYFFCTILLRAIWLGW